MLTWFDHSSGASSHPELRNASWSKPFEEYILDLTWIIALVLSNVTELFNSCLAIQKPGDEVQKQTSKTPYIIIEAYESIGTGWWAVSFRVWYHVRAYRRAIVEWYCFAEVRELQGK